MTAAAVSINPFIQSNFPGTFFSSSSGFTQGDALDDPAIRFTLRKGYVDPAATVPMWGGLAITESLAGGAAFQVGGTNAPSENLDSKLNAATTLANLTGFTVFNQATALIQSAQSRVPSAPAGGAINFYRLGSGARIPLRASAAAITAWLGGVVNPNVYWDTTNLVLTNAGGSGIVGPIVGVLLDSVIAGNSRGVNYNDNSSGFATTGFLNWLESVAMVVLKI
jgi:hypothetical protein